MNTRCGSVGKCSYSISCRSSPFLLRWGETLNIILGAGNPRLKEYLVIWWREVYLFVLGVFRADHVDSSFPSDDITSITHDLDRGPDFHPPGQIRSSYGRRECLEGMMVVNMRYRGCPKTRNQRSAGCKQRTEHNDISEKLVFKSSASKGQQQICQSHHVISTVWFGPALVWLGLFSPQAPTEFMHLRIGER